MPLWHDQEFWTYRRSSVVELPVHIVRQRQRLVLGTVYARPASPPFARSRIVGAAKTIPTAPKLRRTCARFQTCPATLVTIACPESARVHLCAITDKIGSSVFGHDGE